MQEMLSRCYHWSVGVGCFQTKGGGQAWSFLKPIAKILTPSATSATSATRTVDWPKPAQEAIHWSIPLFPVWQVAADADKLVRVDITVSSDTIDRVVSRADAACIPRSEAWTLGRSTFWMDVYSHQSVWVEACFCWTESVLIGWCSKKHRSFLMTFFGLLFELSSRCFWGSKSKSETTPKKSSTLARDFECE